MIVFNDNRRSLVPESLDGRSFARQMPARHASRAPAGQAVLIDIPYGPPGYSATSVIKYLRWSLRAACIPGTKASALQKLWKIASMVSASRLRKYMRRLRRERVQTTSPRLVLRMTQQRISAQRWKTPAYRMPVSVITVDGRSSTTRMAAVTKKAAASPTISSSKYSLTRPSSRGRALARSETLRRNAAAHHQRPCSGAKHPGSPEVPAEAFEQAVVSLQQYPARNPPVGPFMPSTSSPREAHGP